MKVKTSELIGKALDWAVAKCEGVDYLEYVAQGFYSWEATESAKRFSADWAQGGPIIDRIGGFQLKIWLESKPSQRCEAHIHNYEGNWIAFGPTPLVAAMRCYVASKLGDEVDVPEELL